MGCPGPGGSAGALLQAAVSLRQPAYGPRRWPQPGRTANQGQSPLVDWMMSISEPSRLITTAPTTSLRHVVQPEMISVAGLSSRGVIRAKAANIDLSLGSADWRTCSI